MPAMLGAVVMMLDVSGCSHSKLICWSHQNGHSESDIKVSCTQNCAAQCAHLAVQCTVHGAHTMLTVTGKIEAKHRSQAQRRALQNV